MAAHSWIPAYERSKHVKGHYRPALHDGMYLELAEGKEEMFFIAVPDPHNKKKPVLVREDILDEMPDGEYNKLLRYITPFNHKKHLAKIHARRLHRKQMGCNGLGDEQLSSKVGDWLQKAGDFVEDVTGKVSNIANNIGGAVRNFPGGANNPIGVNVTPNFTAMKIMGLPAIPVIIGGAVGTALLVSAIKHRRSGRR